MDAEFWLLGPEGDVLDARAAIHAVAASLALALRARSPVRDRQQRRAIEQQERALVAVAAASARMFRHRDEPGFDIEAAASGLAQLIRDADAREARGVPHDRLVTLPNDWPFARLAITTPSLALAAVMRLRAALQGVVIRGG